MVKPLSGEERVQVSGGCMPPTAEQMEQLHEKYGLLADVVCWEPVSYTHLDVYKRQDKCGTWATMNMLRYSPKGGTQLIVMNRYYDAKYQMCIRDRSYPD